MAREADCAFSDDGGALRGARIAAEAGVGKLFIVWSAAEAMLSLARKANGVDALNELRSKCEKVETLAM